MVAVALAMSIPAFGDEATSLYKKGRDVEARMDYEAAYKLYIQAYQLKPKNLAYRVAGIRVRVLASSQCVHRGQQLRDAGHLEEAMGEFERAALIDPSSFLAQQEIRRTHLMLQAAKDAGKPGAMDEAQRLIDQGLATAAGPVQLRGLTMEPISLKLSEDAKNVYSMLGKLAGINVVFDTDYKPQRISVDLVKVTLEDALQIVAMESKSFYRPVTTNTIYVAADTPAKRKEIEQSVVNTFYLSNMSQASDLTDIATSIRSTLDVTRVTPMPSQGALIVRGTPDQMTLVQKLIDDVDKARPEVTIEVMVMQVTRERIRDLGIVPPTSATLSYLGPNSSSGSPSTGSNAVSLPGLTQLAAKDFSVTIPQITANALFSDSQSKLIQNPQIRALDGQRASLRIGQRYPIATGSFSAGVGSAGISPLVNTQFQYIDVGFNIDVTPRIYANNDVSLKLILDITAVDSLTSIGGIVQPIIGQRKIEHEIRLKDGEINLLGGMLEEADTKSLSGLPLLSSIPLLRYFFSSEQTDKRQNELVFILIPHVIRGQELNKRNHQQVDVGTSNTIELRHPTPASAEPGVPGPSAGVEPAAGMGAPITSAVLPMAESTSSSLGLSAPQLAPMVGDIFMVDVLIDGAQNLLSMPLDVRYDASKVRLVRLVQGSFQTQQEATSRTEPDGSNNGKAQIAAIVPSPKDGFSGKGTVVTLCFTAKAAGPAWISVSGSEVKNNLNHVLPVRSASTSVAIRSKV